jgi:hypothetical protein
MDTRRMLLVVVAFAIAVVGCIGAPAASPAGSLSPGASASGRTGLGGSATAGPVCPVEKVPPDPACAARPVVGATLVVRDGSGREIARATTGPDGTFFVTVPAGTYVVEPQAVQGLMGTAPPQDVTVAAGATATMTVVYDTGIR